MPRAGNNVIITMEISILMHFNCIVNDRAFIHTVVNETQSKSSPLPVFFFFFVGRKKQSNSVEMTQVPV